MHLNLLVSICDLLPILDLAPAYLPEFESATRLSQVFIEDVAEIDYYGQGGDHDDGPPCDVLTAWVSDHVGLTQ